MAAEPPLERFAHIADLHFWQIVTNPWLLMNKRFLGNLTVILRRRYEFVMERAEPFADAIAASGIGSVVLTGDFASTATDEEFMLAASFVRGLQARGMAVHVLPGNHDVYTFEAARERRFEKHFAEFIPPGGYPALVKLPGGTPLILAPTVCPRHLSARGLVTPETVRAVAGLLEECGPLAVVAAHYPLLHTARGYASHPFRRLANAESLRRVLGASGKRILYVCGHTHRFSHDNDAQYPMMEHLCTGGFVRTDPRQGVHGEFSEVAIFPDRFVIHRETFGNDRAV